MLGTTPTMLGITPPMLGTTPTMLGTTPIKVFGIRTELLRNIKNAILWSGKKVRQNESWEMR